MTTNQLILGDNLEKMKDLETESVDLIYLDPPFFSNRNYEVIWGDDGEVRSFQDRWAGGMEHYISWLKERVKQMHRVLKPTGSIFLHCDWHANAYIRVDILDEIFLSSNFRNEIIWKRNSAHNSADRCGCIHDTIFYYQKSDEHKWNLVYQKYNEQYLEEFFDCVDEKGKRYKRADLTGAGTTKGISGEPWRNIDVRSKGRHWAYVHKELDRLDKIGKIHWTKKEDGMPRLKVYPEDMKGVPLQDVWDDIRVLHNLSKERIGYPTQKPEALLQRIIEMASNDGDVVLDPFVGGGTTVVVADKLNRKWIGIDQSVAAIRVSDLRLKNQQDLYSQPYNLQLRTYNAIELRNMNPFEFETFIIKEFGGIPNPKQRNDFGLDGIMPDNTPIQVKRSDNIGRNVIDNFKSASERFDKKRFDMNVENSQPVGYIIAYSFNKGAVEEVARLKNKQHIIIELKRVSEIIPMGNPPEVSLTADEIESNKYALNATAKSEAGVEFFSWDFNHKPEEGFKPEIYLDKEGKQVRKLQPGDHQIAVEAVDKHGLDGMDTIKLNVKET